jgi:predicted TIM-barrel fold metal-dependent hydrolase
MAALASRAPDVQFVLDHCGIPSVRTQELDPWRGYIAALAALPNVACKISGIIAHGHPQHWMVEDLRPFVEHVIQVFGWQRVVWGSDWPVCNLTASLARWVEVTGILVAGASESETAALFHENAKRIYHL